MPRKWWENGGEKTENEMGGLLYEISGKSGRRMENNSNRQKELETVDRKRSEKKARKVKKRRRNKDSDHG